MTRINTKTWLRWHLVAGALLVVVLSGCEPPGKPNPADKPILPDQILGFEELFSMNCAGCHGANGELGPAPPLNDPLFVEIVPAEVLLSVIRDGRPGTPMPPFLREKGGPLTLAQVKVLAEGIKTQWKGDEPPAGSPPAYELSKPEIGQAVAGNRQRGAKLFASACGGCHGPNGEGIESDGVVENALNVPAFLALVSDQSIRRIIITGRLDLGMPNYAEHDGRPDDFQTLTNADVNDLIALMADWRTTDNSIAQTQSTNESKQ